MNLELTEIAARLGAAVVAGCVIGVNRDLANKPIGARTLGLVSLGAASVCVAAVQVDGMWGHPDALSRVVQGIIQGIMAGISLIGAGVILRDAESRTVEGTDYGGNRMGCRAIFCHYFILSLGLSVDMLLPPWFWRSLRTPTS